MFISREVDAAFHEATSRLRISRMKWCVFAGAAATCYGVTRAITDIDLLLKSHSVYESLRVFPGASRALENSIKFGSLDIWCGFLDLKAAGQTFRFEFDDLMASRVTPHMIDGMTVPVMAPEDVIVVKAILQRGDEVGKHDIDDIRDIVAYLGNSLDTTYLAKRADLCRAGQRVKECLMHL